MAEATVTFELTVTLETELTFKTDGNPTAAEARVEAMSERLQARIKETFAKSTYMAIAADTSGCVTNVEVEVTSTDIQEA